MEWHKGSKRTWWHQAILSLLASLKEKSQRPRFTSKIVSAYNEEELKGLLAVSNEEDRLAWQIFCLQRRTGAAKLCSRPVSKHHHLVERVKLRFYFAGA